MFMPDSLTVYKERLCVLAWKMHKNVGQPNPLALNRSEEAFRLLIHTFL
jgi:hypothetical protein